MTQSKIRVVSVEDLNEQDAFAAWGYAHLKVQKGDETLAVQVKIGSVPQDVVDSLRRKAPKPPTKAVMGDPTNADHAAMGVTTRQKLMLPDFNDDEYRVRQEEFDLNFRREVVGLGVLSKLKLKDGRIAETPEERYQALEDRGISGIHFSEIAQQILALTSWSEEERGNFSTTPSAQAGRGN